MTLRAPIRVLCAREFQNSISESVHRVLADQIDKMGLHELYEVQRDHIYGRKGTPAEGTSFSFEGIKNNTSRIKSYEGIDICWVEEAVNTTESSWGILIPTIRKENSEIWMTFNPELETDYTWKRFVLESDQDSMWKCYTTWKDNPWLTQVILAEIERDRARDMDYYLNVWEGHCVQELKGAVYAKELRRAQEDGRITSVEVNLEWPCDVAFDLGRADKTAVWAWQKVAMQHKVIAYHEASQEDLSYYIKWLKSQRWAIGRIWLPHDAKAKRLGTKRSIEEMFRAVWPDQVQIVPRLSMVDGINAARLLLQRCWLDERACSDGIQALRHYKYKVKDGVLSNEPLHDEASDGSDAFRYMAIADGLARRAEALPDPLATRGVGILEAMGRVLNGPQGWMR